MRRETSKKIENGFLESYDKYSANIFRHIYFRVNNRAVTQDIISETFVKTWEYLKNGNSIKSFKSFLYTTANNLIIDYYRRKSKAPLSLEDTLEVAELTELSATENIDNTINIETAKEYLAILPDHYKEIIIYRYIDDLSIVEIKNITGRSFSDIYVTIHRGLKILKSKITKNE